LGGDDDALISVIAEDATLTSDSGGRVRATLKVIEGSDRIARLLIGLQKKQAKRASQRIMLINDDFGIVTYVAAKPVGVLWSEIEGERIGRLYRILNPEKLTRVPDLRVPAETLAAAGPVSSRAAGGLP